MAVGVFKFAVRSNRLPSHLLIVGLTGIEPAFAETTTQSITPNLCYSPRSPSWIRTNNLSVQSGAQLPIVLLGIIQLDVITSLTCYINDTTCKDQAPTDSHPTDGVFTRTPASVG